MCVFEKPCVRIGKTFLKRKRGMHALIAIEKSWVFRVSYLCSRMCIHKSKLMSHFKAKQADIKSRAPFSKRFWNFAQIASQERLFRNGGRKTQNGVLSDTKGFNGRDVQEGGHIWRYFHEGGHSWWYPYWQRGQLQGGGERTIMIWSDCVGDRPFSKWVCEGNGGRFKQETHLKP